MFHEHLRLPDRKDRKRKPKQAKNLFARPQESEKAFANRQTQRAGRKTAPDTADPEPVPEDHSSGDHASPEAQKDTRAHTKNPDSKKSITFRARGSELFIKQNSNPGAADSGGDGDPIPLTPSRQR